MEAKRMFRWTARGGLLATAVLVAACSGDYVTDPQSSDMIGVDGMFSNESGDASYVRVYKIGPAGTYEFEASATGGTLIGSPFTVDAGAYIVMWGQNQIADPADITVTEVVVPGIQVDSIIVSSHGGSTTYYNTNTATVYGMINTSGDARIKFFNSETPPPPTGTQGCTPGYWKQAQHFGNWTGYAPDQQFSDVFEDAFPGMTLLDVVSQGGGGMEALGRHTVAALLNANGSVEYPVGTAQEVIDAFNAVFPDGDLEGQKNIFEGYNELGCDLARAEG